MILKIQCSLISNVGPMILVYNKDRSIEGQFPATPELLAIMEGRPKIYAECELVPEVYDEGAQIAIQHEVEDQDW